MGLIGHAPLPLLRGVGLAWRRLRRSQGQRRVILTYHDIADGEAAELFTRQMEHLSRVAVVMPLAELLRGAAAHGRIACAITFDDGYESVYRNAFPTLTEYRFPAMVFLCSAFIRDCSGCAMADAPAGLFARQPPLSWRQVREMHRCGIGFGSHTAEHGDLSILERADAMDQLRRSREEIALRLGQACDHFAYPLGRYRQPAVDWVREAGYVSAATTLHRGLTRGDDLMRLPRVGIESRYSLHDFAAIVAGDWDFIGWLQTARRPALRMRPSRGQNLFQPD